MKRHHGFVIGVVVLLLGAIALPWMRSQEAKKGLATVAAGNYLYIEEFEIPPGTTVNKAVAESTEMVKQLRKTGEFKTVRLYIHNTGPRFAMYVLVEPKSWQALETGFQKVFAAHPEWNDMPAWWNTHSDNLLSEISVE